MSGWRQVALVAQRDFLQRATSRAFLLTMLLVVTVVLVAGPLLADALRPDVSRDVGVVGQPSTAFTSTLDAAAEQVELEPVLVPVDDRSLGESALSEGDIDVLLVLDAGPATVVWQSEPDPQLATLLTLAVRADVQQQEAADLGLSPDETAALVEPAPPTTVVIDPADPNAEAEDATVFVGMLLLYISVILFGQFVMMAVVEEKSSRVVEVLLSRVLPYRLLAGKVLGIGTLAILQILVLATALYVVVTQVIAPDAELVLGPRLLGSIIFWFLVGFAFYAVLYAALGSTVTRQEDVQSVALLPLLFVLPGYFAAVIATENPDTVLTRVTSLLPPTSPFVMPVRSAVSDVPAWELGLSVVLLVGATYGMIRLAGRIYTGAILSIGAKVSLREAWRSSAKVPTG